MRMRTRLAPWIRAFIVITALLLGQVQVAMTADVSETPEGHVLVPEPDEASGPDEDVLYFPTDDREPCKIRVRHYLLASPFTGPPDIGHPTMGADVEITGDPADPNLAERKAGDETEWLIVAWNDTAGCPDGEEALSSVRFEYRFRDDAGVIEDGSVPLQFVPGPPDTMPTQNSYAWQVYPWTIPSNVNGQLEVRAAILAEAENNPDPAPNPPNDVINFGAPDYVNIVGPGFEVVEFSPDPNGLLTPPLTAAAGQPVEFLVHIRNTRPGSTIKQILVDSASVGFMSTCGGIANWTLYPAGTPLNNTTGLAYGEEAQCIATATVPSDPAPSNYRLAGDLTVSEASDGNDPFNVTEHVISDPALDILLPALDVQKRVQTIRRGGTTIYPPDPLPAVIPGDIITYEIEITNTGDLELDNFWVVDSRTGPVFIAPGTTLPVGDSLLLTTQLIVQEGSSDPLQNTVTVTAEAAGFPVVDAQAIASVDVADSSLEIELIPENPVSGTEITSIEVGQDIRYRLIIRNNSTQTITDLTYIPLTPPLVTLGTPPALIPDTLPAAGTLERTYLYTVQPGDADPLVNTIKLRGQLDGGGLLYDQTQAVVDISNPDIGIDVVVLEPETTTVLRGQTVQYHVTVQNKDAVADLCDVVVKQIRRDPLTGLESTLNGSLSMNWPTGTPGLLPGGSSADATVEYLVTGEDVDPLDMVFEVTALDACPGGNEYIDRTASVLDLSDAQVNTELAPIFAPGVDEVGIIGQPLEFQYIVTNVGAVTLENLSATWCILHRAAEDPPVCTLPFDPDKPLSPTSIGSFEDAQGGFTYDVIDLDGAAEPFIAEVTLTATDNKGNTVKIKTAAVVPIATDDIIFELSGPPEAVVGDTIPFGYSVVNDSGMAMTDVTVYNMLTSPPTEVGFFPLIPGNEPDNVVTGSFDYTIVPNVGIEGDYLTMVARVEGSTVAGPSLATDTHRVKIIPMVDVEKTGDAARVAGQSVHYRVTITNRSATQTLSNMFYDDAVLEGYGVIPSHEDFVPWPDPAQPGVLPPGTSVTGEFRIPGPPEDPGESGVDPAPSPLRNTFVASGNRSYDNAIVSGDDTHSVEIACPLNFNFQVTNLDNDPDDVLGERVRIEISFTNISLDTINNLSIRESLNWNGVVPDDGTSIQWPGSAGTLTPGQTAWLQPFELQITSRFYTQFDNEILDVLNADFAEVGGTANCMEELHYPVFSPVGPIKIPDPFVAFTGETVDYWIRVINVTESDDGIYSNYFVTVYDTLLEPNPIPFEYDPGQPPKTSGWMGPGEVVQTTLSREVLVTDPTELYNVVTAEFPDPVDEEVLYLVHFKALVFTGNPLYLTKTPSTTSTTAGSDILYDYTVTNISPYTVEGITLIDDPVGDLTPLAGGPFTLDPGESMNVLGVQYSIPLDAPDPLVNTFTATGTVIIPDGEDRLISNSITVKVDLQDPDVTVTKWAAYDPDGNNPLLDVDPMDGIAEVDSGTPVYYCFLLENTNPGTATYVADIEVVDVLFPTELQPLFEWEVVNTLGHPNTEEENDKLYGQEAVQFCHGPVPMQASLGDPVVNLVTVTGTGSDDSPIFNAAEYVVDILGVDLQVTKIPSQTVAFVGDELIYTIRLINRNGSYDIIFDEANGDGVVDTFISGAPVQIPLEAFDWSNSGIPGNPVGRLGPAQPQPGYATYSYSYTVQANDPDPLENTVTATGVLDDAPAPEDRTPVTDSTRSAVAVTASQLVVRKTATPTISNVSPENCVIGGDPACKTVRYTISITNIGSSTVYDVSAMDEHFDNSSGTMVQQIFTGNDLSDTELDPFETAYIYYDLAMPSANQLAASPDLDPFINVITAYGVVFDEDGQIIPLPPSLSDPSDPPDISVKGSATATVDLINPLLRAVKSANTLAATPGQDVLYTIQFTNTGSSPLDTLFVEDITGGVVFDLDVDCAGGDPVDCPFTYGPEYIDDDGDPDTPDVLNPVYGELYDPTGHKLPPGEYLIGNVPITVPADLVGSEFTNIVEVRGIPTLGGLPVVDRASETIDIRDDGIQVEKFASVSTAPVGSSVTYTVRVTNIGGSAIDRIIISDAAMDGVPGGMVTVDTGFEGPDPDLLEPGEVYEMQYTHVLTPDDGEVFVNRVSVTAFTEANLALLSIAEAIVDVQQAEVVIEKFVCVGDDAVDDDNDPTTFIDPCTQTVNIGDDQTPDVVTYYLHIYNPSETLGLENLAVTDTVGTPPTISWPAANDGLAPDDGVADSGDDEVWVMYTYTIQPGDPVQLVNLATVTGTAEGGIDVQDTATATVRLVTGDLVITKSAPASAAVGDTVTYNLTIENLSATDDITTITVIDPLSPSGGSPIPACSVSPLMPGASHNCSFNYTITAFDNSPLNNTATANGTQLGAPVSAVDTHSLIIVTPGLSVTKTANTTFAAVGDVVTYTYEVENTGSVAISNLVVTESDSGIVFNEGPWPTSLSVGQTVIRTANRTITASDPDPYTNTITVTGLANGVTPIQAQATETVFIANGSLVVANTPSVPFALPGQTVTFAYQVTNLGTETISNLTIEDNLCFGPGTPLVATLDSGLSTTVYCDAVAALPGPLTSNVYVEGEEPGPIAVFDTATAEVPVTFGGILVTKTATPLLVGTTAPDNVITYTVEVTNVGAEPLGTFVVDDSLGITLLPAPPSTLAAGASFTMTGTYTTDAGDIPTVANTVTVTAVGQNTATDYEDSDSASVAVVADPGTAALTLTKEVSDAAGLPGDPLTYTLTVRNVGAVTVTGITLSDPLLGVNESLPDLGPGNVITRTYNTTIPANATSFEYTNTATASGTAGGNPVAVEASVTVDVQLLEFEKTADPGPYLPGDTVTYNFAVTNNSTADISTVTLWDDMIDDTGTWTTTLPTTIGGSATETASGTYTISMDDGGPTLVNTATLSLDGVVVLEDFATVDIVVAGLDVTLIDIVQVVGTAPDEVELDLAQTGEPVEVRFMMTNTGDETITNLDYDVVIDLPGAVCQHVPPALPTELAGGAMLEVTCTYTPPVGLPEYETTLSREVDITGTGSAGGETLEDTDNGILTLVDLQLDVNLVVLPNDGIVGDPIQFALTISNTGVSSIGCGIAVPLTELCHLSFAGDDTGSGTFLEDLFGDLMTNPDDANDPTNLAYRVLLPGTDITYGPVEYVIQAGDTSMDFDAVVDGGYYSAALETADLLMHYTVSGSDIAETLTIGGPEIEINRIEVNPNPPIPGQMVRYTVYVRNIGASPVTTLTGDWSTFPYVVSLPTDTVFAGAHDAAWLQGVRSGPLFFIFTSPLMPYETAAVEAYAAPERIEEYTTAYQFQARVIANGGTAAEATTSDYLDIVPVGAATGTATPTVDPDTLDPDATTPVVSKEVNSEAAQVGGTAVWTITVRNSWTQTMTNVTLQDNVPTSLEVVSATTNRGASVIDGQLVTVTTGAMAPGDVVTVTITTNVLGGVESPGTITNTACAMVVGGDSQDCDSATVNLGPDVGGLPATGMATPSTEHSRSLPLVEIAGLGLAVGLLALMGAANPNRRALMAVLFVVVALAIVAVAVVIAVMGGDDEADEPSEQADAEATSAPDPTLGADAPTTSAVTSGDDDENGETALQFPPTATPYIVPTPAGVRMLMIPKLGEQFRVPVPIVDVPIEDRQWDVSGLGNYIGWLEGTTWMDSHWGNTVLAAHVQLGFQNPGPFWGLGDLEPGDEIIVTEGDIERRFAVQSITKVDPGDWTVTAPTTEPMLTLITCTEWDNNYGVFSQRLVVRAVPVEATG